MSRQPIGQVTQQSRKDTNAMDAQITTNDIATYDETSTDDQAATATRTRHSLLCSAHEVCPQAQYCPNTGTNQCDDGTGCPAC